MRRAALMQAVSDRLVTAREAATALTTLVPDIADRDLFVCGPDEWAGDVRRAALAAGVPADRFHVESFGW